MSNLMSSLVQEGAIASVYSLSAPTEVVACDTAQGKIQDPRSDPPSPPFVCCILVDHHLQSCYEHSPTVEPQNQRF